MGLVNVNPHDMAFVAVQTAFAVITGVTNRKVPETLTLNARTHAQARSTTGVS